MSYYPYPKRDPIKNYFPLPNEIYYLDLSAGAIAIYGYLLHIESRKTYQCHASHKTIGQAVKMSTNTVRKYLKELEDRALIYTEQTTIRTKEGQARNGTLLYTIRPIQEAVDYYYERQLQQLNETTVWQKVQLSPPCAPCVSVSEAGQAPTPPTPQEAV